MAVQITSTRDKTSKPPLVATIYGKGKVGKTSLAATAPSPIFIDAEAGTVGLGARGIEVPVVHVTSWNDIRDAWLTIKESDKFKTVVIDPTGAFIGMLIEHEKRGGTNPGTMNMHKWASVKDKFRSFLWDIKRSGKHALFVAHEKKDKDDESILRSPDVAANMGTELVNLCDVIGHLRVVNGKRVLRVQPDANYDAGDRFGVLGEEIETPNMTAIIDLIHSRWDDPPFPDSPPADATKKK